MKSNLIDLLFDKNICTDTCAEYGEPGYTLEEGKTSILFGDWNELDKYPNIMGFIEKHFEIEWSDEWVIDYENYKAYRCSPDSYSWQPSYVLHKTGEVLGVDFINDMSHREFFEFLDTMDYFNNPKTAINLCGFKPRGEDITKDVLGREQAESGWYEGQDDKPYVMIRKAQGMFSSNDFFYFVVDYTGQFDIGFLIYKF